MSANKEYKVEPLFATPLYRNSIDLYNSVEEVKKLKYERTHENNGFISINHNILSDDNFLCLKQEIDNNVKTFVYDVLDVKNNLNIKLLNSWAVRHIYGDWAQDHTHSNSLFSGIVYLQCDNDSGDLRFAAQKDFIDTNSIRLDYNNYNNVNATKINYLPRPGDIFIFPSLLSHGVATCNSYEDRYCIAFNVTIEGTIGSNNSGIGTLSLS